MDRVNYILIGLVTALIYIRPVIERNMSNRLQIIKPNRDIEAWQSRDLTDHLRSTLMDSEAVDPRGQIIYDRSTFVCGEENCGEIHTWDKLDENGKPTILECEAFDVYSEQNM